MSKKMMSPNTTIWWVPSDATVLDTDGVTEIPFDPAAPSAAFLTADRNISSAVVSGYTLNATESDVDDSTAITDGANVETPTFYNYEGNITYFREGDPADTTSDYYRAFQYFKHADAAGFLVRRLGYLASVPAAASQKVSSYLFSSDWPQDVLEDNGPIQFTVPYLPQGVMELSKALVA